jgi:hypothetical protein
MVLAASMLKSRRRPDGTANFAVPDEYAIEAPRL